MSDKLAPARGALIGLALSAIFWAALAALLFGCASRQDAYWAKASQETGRIIERN